MNYEEVDAWYEEQKQRLLNEYINGLEQKKEHKQLKAEFEKGMKQVYDEYEKLSLKALKQNKLSKVRKGLKKLTGIMHRISKIYK